MDRYELIQNAKPILFNTEMVRAILDGRKTVTRRVIKPQPKCRLSYIIAGYGIGKWLYPGELLYEFWGEEYRLPEDLTEEDKNMKWSPPCHTDDILYVRETWSPLYQDKDSKDVCGYMYKAYTLEEYDKMYPDGKDYQWEGKWRPSIHMPKEAARIFLKVTNVLVERLQEIDDEQAKEEGANWRNGKNVGFEEKMRRSAVERFAEIWNSTIKKSDLDRYGWDANPWVWVIEFERISI